MVKRPFEDGLDLFFAVKESEGVAVSVHNSTSWVDKSSYRIPINSHEYDPSYLLAPSAPTNDQMKGGSACAKMHVVTR